MRGERFGLGFGEFEGLEIRFDDIDDAERRGHEQLLHLGAKAIMGAAQSGRQVGSTRWLGGG